MIMDPATMLNFGPGTLPRWVRWVVRIACVVTVLAVALGGQLIVQELAWQERASNSFWLRDGAAWLATLAIVIAAVPHSRTSRLVRVAVLLPLIHAGLVALVWYVWTSSLPLLSASSDGRAFAADFPLVSAWASATIVFASFSIAVARKGDWAHGFAMFALAELLLLGLWMPLSASITSAGAPSDWWFTDAPLLPHPIRSALLVVIPPTLVAASFTALSLRRRAEMKVYLKVALWSLLGLAVLARLVASPRSMVVYSNFVPVLLAAALVAITGVAALALSTLVSGYRLRRTLARTGVTGVVHADGDEPVFGIEIPSWLRGPRLVQRPFEIATPTGRIPVTGAVLIAPLPDSTTLLGRTEMLGLVNPGQTVTVYGGGYDTGGPFRASSALLSGSIYVAPAGIAGAKLASASLALWRPCVAYLLIVTAVALPALVAVLA